MFAIPDDAVLTVSFDVRAVTPEGSQHLFTHVMTPEDNTVQAVADSLAMAGIDSAEAFLNFTEGVTPEG